MATCLLPAGWALDDERRAPPFRARYGTAEWVGELAARTAIWRAWIYELGGCSFVEPASETAHGPFSYVLVAGATTRMMRLDNRSEALALAAEMRRAGFEVHIEVESVRPRRN